MKQTAPATTVMLFSMVEYRQNVRHKAANFELGNSQIFGNGTCGGAGFGDGRDVSWV